MNKLPFFELINLPKIEDPRGNLSVIEKDVVPFEIKRVYYLYDVPSGAERGGHAHKNLKQLLISLSGSFDVILKKGDEQVVITLNRPNIGLLIPTGVWRELHNFSSGSVCLVLASAVFDEDDYIRDFDEFMSFKD
ncbi:sugar 3,4-ketoisomerase [Flavobacterium ajazii]|uniref:sugar 3,4-ketoisomerase n=1 Tax=Flavobacterium ajazii TaxID=2692318 RepID=UPI0013D8CE9C|nr:FdtA/QdtA family cupin domain-containing protein [Flavobacterium ajazii]